MRITSRISKSFLLFFAICILSCTKDSSNNELSLSYHYLSEKTWYLDYSQTDSLTKTFIGQSTYHINFLKNKNTTDSDGLSGTYTVEMINNQLQIHVQAFTKQLNPIEYIYNLESIGAKHLVLSYSMGGSITTLFYSIK